MSPWGKENRNIADNLSELLNLGNDCKLNFIIKKKEAVIPVASMYYLFLMCYFLGKCSVTLFSRSRLLLLLLNNIKFCRLLGDNIRIISTSESFALFFVTITVNNFIEIWPISSIHDIIKHIGTSIYWIHYHLYWWIKNKTIIILILNRLLIYPKP